MYQLNDKAQMVTRQEGIDYWGLRVNFLPKDLLEKPFDLKYLRNLIKLCRKKMVRSSAAGKTVEELKRALKKYKDKKKK